MIPVVAFEGLPFAGKTTTIKRLASALSSAVVVPEYHDVISEQERKRLSVPPASVAEQRARLDRYAEIEQVRWETLHSHADIILVDRSYLSLLAYAKALRAESGHSTDVTSYKLRFQTLISDSSHPARPLDRVVFFSLPAADSEVRARNQHSATLSPLLKRPFLAFLEAAYPTILDDSAQLVCTVAVQGASEYGVFSYVRRMLGDQL